MYGNDRRDRQPAGPATYGTKPSSAFYDSEANDEWSSSPFSDKRIRHAFISKVYSILTTQLFFTFGSMTFVMFNEPIQEWLLENMWLSFVAMGGGLVLVLVLCCFESVRRTSPINYILLILFTLCQAFLFSIIGMLHAKEEIFMAIGITAIVVFVLTLFAVQTKIDFTGCGALFMVLLVILIVLGIVAIFFPSKTMTMVRASLGVLVFSLYLIYDTQLIMGGRAYEIGPEDYIFASLTLYIDIINLFISLLQLIASDE